MYYEREFHHPTYLVFSPDEKILTRIFKSDYDGAGLNGDDPLDGSSIQKNAYMFICGASVNCHEMMEFATDAVDDATEVIEDLMPTVYNSHDLARFHEPLRVALTMVFDQGDGLEMGSMRLALARLVDVSLMYLVLNPAFKIPFEMAWCPYVIMNCIRDNKLYKRLGWLDAPPEGQESGLDAAMQTIRENADPDSETQDAADLLVEMQANESPEAAYDA
jgi:hypothetical protein